MGRKIHVVSFLCGRQSCKDPPPPDAVEDRKVEYSSDEAAAKWSSDASSDEKAGSTPPPNTDSSQPLPPPPGHTRAASYHQRTSSTSSLSKLSSTMSMRMIGNGLSSRHGSKREDPDKKKTLKHEDSIWKKQIILGEKCKVPQEDDDTILYDEYGNRISAYHPRTPCMLSSSRQASSIDQHAVARAVGQGEGTGKYIHVYCTDKKRET